MVFALTNRWCTARPSPFNFAGCQPSETYPTRCGRLPDTIFCDNIFLLRGTWGGMARGGGFLWRCFALLGILIHAPARSRETWRNWGLEARPEGGAPVKLHLRMPHFKTR